MTLKSWGTRWHQDIFHARDYKCECNNFDPIQGQGHQHIVGFDTSITQSSCALNTDEEQKVGVIIYRCPECHELFWMHVTALRIAGLKKLVKDWPEDQNTS